VVFGQAVRSVACPYSCDTGVSRARRSTEPWKLGARRLHKRHMCLASRELMPPRSHAGEDRQSDAAGSESQLRCRSWLGQRNRPASRLLLAQRPLHLSWPTTHPAWRATIVCIAVGPLHPRCLAPKNTLSQVVEHFTSAPCKLSRANGISFRHAAWQVNVNAILSLQCDCSKTPQMPFGLAR